MGHFVFELNLEVQSILVQISFWLLLFQVQTDGHLSIEFTFDEYMRIRSWKFNIKDNMELVDPPCLIVKLTKPNQKSSLQMSQNMDFQKLRFSISGYMSIALVHFVANATGMFLFLLPVIFIFRISAFQILRSTEDIIF